MRFYFNREKEHEVISPELSDFDVFVSKINKNIGPEVDEVVLKLVSVDISEEDWDFFDSDCEPLSAALNKLELPQGVGFSLHLVAPDIEFCPGLVQTKGLKKLTVEASSGKFLGIFKDLEGVNSLIELKLSNFGNYGISLLDFQTALTYKNFKVQKMEVPICIDSYYDNDNANVEVEEQLVKEQQLMQVCFSNITLTDCNIKFKSTYLHYVGGHRQTYSNIQAGKERLSPAIDSWLERNKEIQRLFEVLGEVEEGSVAEQNKIKAELFEYLYRYPKVQGNGRELLLTKMFGNAELHSDIKKLADLFERLVECKPEYVVPSDFNDLVSGMSFLEAPDMGTLKSSLEQKFNELRQQALFRLQAFDQVDLTQFQQILKSGDFPVVTFAPSAIDNQVVLSPEGAIKFSVCLGQLASKVGELPEVESSSDEIEYPIQAVTYAVAALAYDQVLQPSLDNSRPPNLVDLEKSVIAKLEAAVKAKGFDGGFETLSDKKVFPKDDLSRWIGVVKHVLTKAAKVEGAGKQYKDKKPRQVFADKLRLVLQDVVDASGELFGNSNGLFADNMGKAFEQLGQAAFPDTPAEQAADTVAKGSNSPPSWNKIKAGKATYQAKVVGSAPSWISVSGGPDSDPGQGTHLLG